MPDDFYGFPTGPWRYVEGRYDDNKPILVRFNEGLHAIIDNTDHIARIGFAIPLNYPNPGGFPHPDENDQIGEIEDCIRAAMTAEGSNTQALALTTGTFKEFVFYAQPDFDVKVVHEKLMDEIESHEVQCCAYVDREWKLFQEWSDWD